MKRLSQAELERKAAELDEREAKIAAKEQTIEEFLVALATLKDQIERAIEKGEAVVGHSVSPYDNMPLHELRLETYVENALLRNECATVGDVIRLAQNGELQCVVGIGAKSVENILYRLMDKYGLSFWDVNH